MLSAGEQSGYAKTAAANDQAWPFKGGREMLYTLNYKTGYTVALCRHVSRHLPRCSDWWRLRFHPVGRRHCEKGVRFRKAVRCRRLPCCSCRWRTCQQQHWQQDRSSRSHLLRHHYRHHCCCRRRRCRRRRSCRHRSCRRRRCHRHVPSSWCRRPLTRYPGERHGAACCKAARWATGPVVCRWRCQGRRRATWPRWLLNR